MAKLSKSDDAKCVLSNELDAPGAELALHGIQLLLNNNSQEAEALFTQYREKSIQMSAGYCFIAFMQAMMTFEEEKLTEAMQVLKSTEKRCAEDVGMLRSMKKLVMGQGDQVMSSLELRLEQQIIVADCQVCMALLTFTNQDLTSYVKGGWILRKAWKVYDRTYREIKNLYESHFGGSAALPNLADFAAEPCFEEKEVHVDELSSPDGWMPPEDIVDSGLHRSGFNMPRHSIPSEKWASIERTNSVGSISNLSNSLPAETILRLMSAVSFGYGAFQLSISLLPPSLLKIIHFLGFEGDRDVGLKALHLARRGHEMRAPLASLGLLWYHTIVRPFFALDGSNVAAGADEAQRLIDESTEEYGSSALFLFFRGRIARLKSNIDEALVAYNTSIQAANQREVQLMCLHEIGWCNVMKFQWREANQAYFRLKEESRWSKSFYAYLIAVCLGSLGQLKETVKILKEIPSLVRKKNNQLEAFVLKRSQRLCKATVTQELMLLSGMELLFLWNAIPCCPPATLERMLAECDRIVDKNLLHLKSMIEGAIHYQMGNWELATQCYQESIARAQDIKEDQYVCAYSSYELSLLLLQNSKTAARGQDLLQQAKDNYKNYDFENRLSVRLHAAMKTYGLPSVVVTAVEMHDSPTTVSLEGLTHDRDPSAPPRTTMRYPHAFLILTPVCQRVCSSAAVIRKTAVRCRRVILDPRNSLAISLMLTFIAVGFITFSIILITHSQSTIGSTSSRTRRPEDNSHLQLQPLLDGWNATLWFDLTTVTTSQDVLKTTTETPTFATSQDLLKTEAETTTFVNKKNYQKNFTLDLTTPSVLDDFLNFFSWKIRKTFS